ncbi:MAG TPA: hypothetical protein DDY78_00990 [Planctomycetales bacterium]|nr:hypothetical protein [Planctomycetales bacterium]
MDSETRVAGADPKAETRYFAASSDPGRVTPDDLLAAVRGHCQVENGLHFRPALQHAGEGGIDALAVLLKAVVTVLRGSADPEDVWPLRARTDALAWDVE